MAALAITLELGIKVLVTWPIGIRAVRPFSICAFDRETTYPFSQRILDRQRVGHIVASSAHLRPNKHCLVVALMFGGIDPLEGNVLAKNLAGVSVLLRRRGISSQRPKTLRR